jgi:ATP-binding cassette subfamily A (ABC1) protein 5
MSLLLTFKRCLGSTQHLKNKYGGGYILDLKCKNLPTWNELHDQIIELFGGTQDVKLEESFADRRTYSVAQSAVKSLGQVFASLEKRN